jgi:hypothetical protein
MLEGLEQRWVPSQAAGGLPIVADSSPPGGVFFHDYQQFNYTIASGTNRGTHLEIQIVGRGSLQGTRVDSSGALHLLFSRTNAYTKIVSNVHGGTGQADLASIYSADLFNHSAAGSLSGIGASVIKMINLGNLNLREYVDAAGKIVPGTIDATSGIGTLNLNSVGPNTQIQLRELPSTVTAGTTTTTTTSSTISNSFVTDAFLVQSLAGINGEFVSAGNIVNVTVPGNPGPPPAPPGIVIKINHINGNVARVPNLLTDAEIFGYDQKTGDVVRFNIDLTTGIATPDMSFNVQPPGTYPVQPPGSTSPVALSVGRDGNRLVLLVSTPAGAGNKISVYDATYGTPLGSFTTPAGFNALASTDTVSVIGSVTANQLQMIDVQRSLDPANGGTVQPPVDNPGPYNPPASLNLNLVGGLTGLPGSNQVYATIAATFNSFQPTVPQLGLLTVGTSSAKPGPGGGLVLTHNFSTVSEKGILSPTYTPVDTGNNPQSIGVPMGSVDSSLALNTIVADPKNAGQYINTVQLLGPVSLGSKGTITLKTTDPITDLSETFRPDLTGSTANGSGPALIDVQGNIQSLRGLTANGLVLNDTGYLNLIKTGQIANSTILAQPIGHIQTPQANRTNVTLVSSANRDFGARDGVTLVPGLNQIGPLSLTNDSSSS